MHFLQRLEGQDTQQVRKGTADAKQLTLSFWVKSNVTGTYVVELQDTPNVRRVSAAYTVSASATWEQKTITFPADTTGVLDNDNTTGLNVHFWLGAGSGYTSGTLNTTWTTPNIADRAVGQTNLAAATNNYWQITGVQLEVGPVATPFEFEPFEATLRKCQRYYQRYGGDAAYQWFGTGVFDATTSAIVLVDHKVPMRVAPSSLEWSLVHMSDIYSSSSTPTGVGINHASKERTSVALTGGSGMTQGRVAIARANNSTSAYLAFNAEL
jgi:hypothetical protein